MSGVGLGVSALSGLRVPNFVTSVIYSNPLYLTAYSAALVVLALLGLSAIFVFHFVLLCRTRVGHGMRDSARLLRSHFSAFVGRFLLQMVGLGAAVGLVVVLLLSLAMLPGALMTPGTPAARFVLLFGMLLAGSALTPKRRAR